MPLAVPMATDPGHWRPSIGVQGQDVSAHQGNVDWQAQWNQGSRWAYVKASEGNYYLNENYAQQYNGSRNIGMIRGAYHFAIPNWSSGADQARYFVANGGGWSADGYTLPPVLDIEYNPYEGRTINGFYFGNVCYDMSAAQMTSWISDFGNTVLSLTGRYPVIYSTTDWWSRCTGNAAGFGEYPLWIAAYPSSPSDSPGVLPAGWDAFSMWQYSSTGPFAGDSNVWNGDYAALQRFATGAPPSDPTRKMISVGDFNGDGSPDLLGRKANGTLWFYRGDGAGKFGAGQQIGWGWEIYDQIAGVGDYNSDGKNDIVARKMDGSLWFYAGTGSVTASNQGYSAGVKIGQFGWDAFDALLGIGDFNGDGKTDLLGRRPDGTLWLYRGNGTGQTGTGQQVDFGWEVFNQLIAARDLDGNGTNDILARKPDGTLWFYANTGTGKLVSPRQIGTGWGIYSEILGLGDANGDRMSDFSGIQADGSIYFYAGTNMHDLGYQPARKIGDFGWNAFDILLGTKDFDGKAPADLLARMPNGTLWFYPGASSGNYGVPTKIGNFGWEAFDALVAAGDVNGDGKNDLIARKPDGTLWFYAGTGRVDSTSSGYLPGRKIGDFGWDAFDAVVGVGDFTGDAKADLIARGRDGSLWLYRGTGKVDATSAGYLPGVKIGNFGWEGFTQLIAGGDVDGDGRNDLLAKSPNGALWFYPGNGSGGLLLPRRIDADTASYDTIVTGWNLASTALTDRVSRRADGSLWIHAGTGMQLNQGYLGRQYAGTV
ncbi:GH25 family lysozyme [Arthrobacter sp. CJ23]|uniref:GH25 family lysozyme n=1 Tax=Arthrobacter sp. CJ23 TaxID=2972479 RepID=UPI00215C5B8D|nr:GH25 family lysozyme [Arthrobacter sp. CJ23]UVJ38298.1 FG-GAP-like repeat-containing protein [Arthrobacter sp. CJ23]